MTTPSVVICTDASSLAAQAADFITRCACEAIRQRQRFVVALAGGTTPEKTYTRAGRARSSGGDRWKRTYVFFGDERFVPRGHADSNYEMARRSLLSRVSVPQSQVYPVSTETTTVAEAAAEYGLEVGRSSRGGSESARFLDLPDWARMGTRPRCFPNRPRST